MSGATDHGGLLPPKLEGMCPLLQLFDMRQLYIRDPDNYMPCFQWSAEG